MYRKINENTKKRTGKNAEMIRIYNTLTREKEDFVPLKRGKVSMYVCGPTVYDVPHIGHARSAYIFDVIRRYLEYDGYDVLFVRNVTDVDDKIINKALSELGEIGEPVTGSRLKQRVKEVSARYLAVYHDQLEVLGIMSPTLEPRATETISDMIEFIKVLLEKGHAYASGNSVYFSIESFSDYGRLSHQDVGQIMHGVRIERDPRKRHPLDFVLWKAAKKDEPSWGSPWGDGRPGWHIECSVMSTRLLGKTFDIHGGGLDLIFPHHENEIAQAKAATGSDFARYWIHNGLLSVSGEKMSKSLGNYITISDYLAEHRDPDLLKLTFLNSHYRSSLDYTGEKIEEAARARERIMIFLEKADRVYNAVDNDGALSRSDNTIMTDAQDISESLTQDFRSAMNDDFNTPLALSVVFEAVKKGNEVLADSGLSVKAKAYMSNAIKNFILRGSGVLGLSLNSLEVADSEKDKIESLVSARDKARDRKDYSEADRIRRQLGEMGIVIEDTQGGTVWRKK